MNHYKPKLSHAVFISLFCILFSYLWAISPTDKIAATMLFAATLFLIILSAIVFMLLEGAHYYSVTAYIEALVKMDTDLRNALAFTIPSLRLVARRGQVQTLFDNTQATKEHIHLFLQDSTQIQTASKRNWHTAERPAWAWEEIYNYLRDRKMVGEFATGPGSYPWVGTAYQNLSVYFLTQTVQNLSDDSRVYASEV